MEVEFASGDYLTITNNNHWLRWWSSWRRWTCLWWSSSPSARMRAALDHRGRGCKIRCRNFLRRSKPVFLISSFTFKYISKGTCKSWLVKQLKRVQCQMVTISSFLFDGIGRVLCYRKALRRRRRVMAITMANGHHIVSTDPNRKRLLGHKIEPGLRNIPFVVANIIFSHINCFADTLSWIFLYSALRIIYWKCENSLSP